MATKLEQFLAAYTPESLPPPFNRVIADGIKSFQANLDKPHFPLDADNEDQQLGFYCGYMAMVFDAMTHANTLPGGLSGAMEALQKHRKKAAKKARRG